MGRKKLKCGIKDIARECGVSPATVSRIFHQHPNVKDSIREKVLCTAQKLNYRQELRSVKKVIAIILMDFDTQRFGIYHTLIIPPLVKAINSLGYNVIFVSVNELELLKRYFVFGAISVAFYNDLISRNWDNNFNIPLTVINSPGRKLDNAYSVRSNEEQGMYLAVEHLAQNGHRKIGLIIDGNIDMNTTKRKRYTGYMKALRKFNCEEQSSLVQMPDQEDWMPEIGRLVRNGATALICCGEHSNYKVDFVMNLFRKKVPDDISLISFENNFTSGYCTPPHTTIGQNFKQLATEAAKQIDTAIKQTSQPKNILVDYILTKRESVKKIN